MQSTFDKQIFFLLFLSVQPVTQSISECFSFKSPPHDMKGSSKKWTKCHNWVEITNVQTTVVLLQRVSQGSCV